MNVETDMMRMLSALTGQIDQSLAAAIAIRSVLIAAIGLSVAGVIRRTRASIRHVVLAATFVALLILPLSVVLIPDSVAVKVPVASILPPVITPPTSVAIAVNEAPLPRPAAAVNPRSGFAPSLVQIVSWVWAAGALAILVTLVTGVWRLSQIRRAGLPWLSGRNLVRRIAPDTGVRRAVDVLVHEMVAAPLALGVLRPAILLSRDARKWSDADLHRALVHELEHIRRADWLVQLLAHVACAVFWFNPLVWIARRQLYLEAERACDDAVVAGAESTAYAEQLLQLAERMSKSAPQPALAMARRSDLSARVSAILDATQRRGRAGVVSAVAAFAAMFIAVAGVASLRAVAVSADAPQQKRASGALDRALYEAADEGELDTIKALLGAGANVNAAVDGDGSPLIGAARSGHIAAVRLLLDSGADPNLAVLGDGNPLIMAAREGHAEIVGLLLSRGARVDEVVRDDENALIQASGSGHLPVVKLLVERGADVNARVWAEGGRTPRGEWRTPLSMARRGGHAAVVSFLMTAGARE